MSIYQYQSNGQRLGNRKYKCVGYRNKYLTCVRATEDCIDRCYFVRYGKGKHWVDDYVKCGCPQAHKVWPGDIITVKKTSSIKVDRQGKRETKR